MSPSRRDLNGGTADTMHADLSLLSLDEDTIAATGEEGFAYDYDEEEPPERVGRYLILERLGAGGMGVVYAAYDPDLDRKLAIKLLHDGDERSTRTTIRLLREAQALARVSHPNVIQVYDVGTFDERVYIAMEFVDGLSLKAWVREKERGLEAIVRTFSQAGHGLAAAHACGLVHRDFKPDNVIVAQDGRVVVLDFGIAHAVNRADDNSLDGDSQVRQRFIEHSGAHPAAGPRLPPSLQERSGSTDLALDTELTRAGALLGTPAYMAPEQFASAETDARSDQFSFCVTLWEALHGQRPYGGDSALGLWQSVREGRLRQASSRRLPPGLQRALVRGLDPDPEQRFPSMAELLAILDRDPRATRRRVGAGLALVGALCAGAWGVDHFGGDAGPECTGAKAGIEETWGGERRAQLEGAFIDTGLPFAAAVLPGVQAGLDAYAQQWRAGYTDICEATHVLGEQSEALLDLRMACLEERRAGLDALLEVFLEPDATVVENSLQAVSKLEPIAGCDDRVSLEAEGSIPSGEEAADIEAIRGELVRARARRDAGDVERATSLVTEAHARALTLEHLPTRAAAKLELGLTQLEAGTFDEAGLSLKGGFYLGLATGSEATQFAAALALTELRGDQQQRFEAAEHWADIAGALLDHRGGPLSEDRVLLEFFVAATHWRQGELDRAQGEFEGALEHAIALGAETGEDTRLLEIRVRKGLGSTLWAQGRADAAAEQFQEVVDTLSATLGPSHPKVGSALNNLASAHFSLGRYAQAEGEFVETLRLLEGSYGDEHPSVTNTLNNLAVVRGRQGKDQGARETFERVVEIQGRTLEPDDPRRASTWSNLGRTYSKLHEYERAAEVHRKAYELRRAVYGDSHDETMSSLEGLAVAQIALGHEEQALTNFQTALDTRVEALGADHPSVAETLLAYGKARASLGEARAAEALLRKSLAMRERVLAADHPDTAASLSALATLLVEQGRPTEGEVLLERFMAMEAAAEPPAVDRAQVRLDLAKVLEARGLHQAARERAQAGAALLADNDAPDSAQLREALEAWLRAHP